jgi:hypothetical protein
MTDISTSALLRNLWLALLCSCAIGAAVPALAQSNLVPGDTVEVQRAIDRFLSLNASSQLMTRAARPLFAGEWAKPSAATFGPLPQTDRIIMLADKKAVARLPTQGEDWPDLYLYLESDAADGHWSIIAGRSLALTGIPRSLRKGLRAKPLRTAEEDAALANIELTLLSDRQLRDWFEQHRLLFDEMRVIAQSARAGNGGKGTGLDDAKSRALVKSLHLSNLSIGDDGVVNVHIGGMVDNDVGFLHAEDVKLVPPIDGVEYIWVEPVGDGWYLYKTT